MFDPNSVPLARAALLMMHFQADVFALLFGNKHAPLLDEANALIGRWREMGRPVIFANFALGAEYEKANANNRLLAHLIPTGLFREPAPVAGLAIEPDDRLYSCPRVSVFHGTSLDTDLRAASVDTLVMAGLASSGVVLSSLASASDADYRIHLVKSCCYDPDADAHDALFRTGFQTRAVIEP